MGFWSGVSSFCSSICSELTENSKENKDKNKKNNLDNFSLETEYKEYLKEMKIDEKDLKELDEFTKKKNTIKKETEEETNKRLDEMLSKL